MAPPGFQKLGQKIKQRKGVALQAIALVAFVVSLLALAVSLKDHRHIEENVPNVEADSDLIFEDLFSAGYRTGAGHFTQSVFGATTFDDGTVTTTDTGILISSNPFTGTSTQGTLGSLDHGKWVAYTTKSFTIPEDGTTSCAALVRVTTFNTSLHTFGGNVTNYLDDLRLATGGLLSIDLTGDSYLVADMLATNQGIYAVYGRLPLDTTAYNGTGGAYAAFLYAVKVATRNDDDFNMFEVLRDRYYGRIIWRLDGNEVFRVDRPGYHLASREWMLIDNGGEEELVPLTAVQCGLGTLDFLDGYPVPNPTLTNTGKFGLVKLTTGITNNYYAPAAVSSAGVGVAAQFVDNASLDANRLFGQGAEVEAGQFRVWRTEYDDE